MNAGNVKRTLPEQIDLTRLIVCPEALACLTAATAKRLCLLPIALIEQGDAICLVLACSHLPDHSMHERIAKHISRHYKLWFVQCASDYLQAAIDDSYRVRPTLEQMLSMTSVATGTAKTADDMPDLQVELWDALLRQSVRMRASDVHLSPETDQLQIRLRIDGVLLTYACLDKAYLKTLTVRLKIMAALDIAESRFPQDAQFSRYIDGQMIDFRVSTFPTIDGENTVLRIIDHRTSIDSVHALNLSSSLSASLAALMKRPDGMVVVCGPTGAGKSTTLFTLLNEIDITTQNVMTLEDPVERCVAGIRQTNIDASRQWGYAQGVRALLRQDPDVLLIGEIRDADSCAMALRAVSTGHKVLTTVHANCAHSALHRLRELNAAAGALSLVLAGIVAQRLVRRVCTECTVNMNADAEASTITNAEINTEAQVSSDSAHELCQYCFGSGFHGRQLVMEYLDITPDIRELLARDAQLDTIRKVSEDNGFISMREHAAQLVAAAMTTQTEVDRVL